MKKKSIELIQLVRKLMPYFKINIYNLIDEFSTQGTIQIKDNNDSLLFEKEYTSLINIIENFFLSLRDYVEFGETSILIDRIEDTSLYLSKIGNSKIEIKYLGQFFFLDQYYFFESLFKELILFYNQLLDIDSSYNMQIGRLNYYSNKILSRTNKNSILPTSDNSLFFSKKDQKTYKTHQGKTYTQEEWEAYEQKLWEKHQKRKDKK